MGIWDRLGDVIRSYLTEGGDGSRGGTPGRGLPRDPDLEAAYEELDEFLSGPGGASPFRKSSSRGTGAPPPGAGGGRPFTAPIPGEIRRDFAELGLEPGASPEDCKAAYKRLLKVHHPDRHAGHPGNLKKATEKSARINAAYDRIEKWRNKKP
jgi:DnaJ-domain-containing protein 1